MAPTGAQPFVNLVEVERLAHGRVPKPAYDYVAGGSGDERTLHANRDAFARWRLLHRALVDVSDRTTETTVLGRPIRMPVVAAPTAFHKLVHPQGEVATAQGVHAAGTLLVASTLSTTSLEDVAQASGGPKWFQVYIYRDRALTQRLVERAKRAGYQALVLTVDAPVWGRRERDVRNAFGLPPGLRLANFETLTQERLPDTGGQGDALAAYVAAQLDPAVTGRDVEWLRDISGLPVVVKGIVHPDDARRAVRHGADAVVVSNHGGRQLDAGVATLDALPEVVAAVDGAAEVYVDGGVRRGTDVLTALALGARAVLVGRPLLWALALDGAAGVQRALDILRDEFDAAMALCGLARPDQALPGLLRPAPGRAPTPTKES